MRRPIHPLISARAAAAAVAGTGRRRTARRQPSRRRPSNARARRPPAPDGGAFVHPPGELRVGVDVEHARVGVDHDHVAVAHRRERPAAIGLGRDVADHQPARRTREAAVGDQRDRLPQADADDRGRDAEHLARRAPPAGPS